MEKIKSSKIICPDCKQSANVIEDYRNGYNVCGECGCVLKGRIIDEGTEWRSFSESTKPDRSRVGSAENPFLETGELDTMVSGGPGSHILNKMQTKNYVRAAGRALKIGLDLINGYCEQNFLPKTITDRSFYIFKMVESKKLLRGKNMEAIVSACIYIACKLEGCPRTFKEISVITSIPKREIGKCYKHISKEVDDSGIFATAEIIPRFCSELNLNSKIQTMASDIARKVQEIGCLAGRSPDSVAAAIIHLTLFIFPAHISLQKNIQNVTNVTDSTIKNTYRELIPYIPQLVPAGMLTNEARESLTENQ